MERRVVITGMGAVTPIGNTVSEFWDSIKANRHGFTLEQWFPTFSEEVNVVSRVKNFDASSAFDKKEIRRTDRVAQFAVIAAKEALANAGTDFKDTDPYRCGVIVGSGIGGFETTETQARTFTLKGPGRVSVFTIPMLIGNMASGVVAIKTGFKGANFCPVSACASGTHAIGETFRMIKHGYLDAAITGGAEACSVGFAYAGFNNMHAITTTKDVDRASIPFDKERSGFVLGDGAGILILESLEHARKRGANILAEIKGYGATCDAYHETSPAPDGAGGAMSMKLAVFESGLPFDKINYINAHGTSTAINDRTETAAIKTTFGNHAKDIAINSTKSMTGHLLGAAGAIESVVTVLQIRNKLIHKTVGYTTPDPDCDLDYVTEGNREVEITGAVSNSLGFGGHNATLCFAPFTD